MERWGPRGTIPPPRERPKAARSWPLQVVIGVAVVAGVYLVMRQFKGETAPEPATPAAQAPVASSTWGDESIPAAPATAPAAPAKRSDDEFRRALIRGQLRALLRGLDVSEEAAQPILDLHLADAASSLRTRAAQGDTKADATLARLAQACTQSAPPPAVDLRGASAIFVDAPANAVALDEMPAKTRERIRLASSTAEGLAESWQTACKQAKFDIAAVNTRLRTAATNGDETSLWLLGSAAGDVETQRKLWTSAAMLGFPPAQLDLAKSYWADNALANDHTDRGRMNFWLQAAAKTDPHARAMLGQCELNGCNLQPPDPQHALGLLKQAAQQGDLLALDQLSTAGVGEAGSMSNEEFLAQLTLAERLNDLGCYGAQHYPLVARVTWEQKRNAAGRMSPFALKQADAVVENVWRAHGASAQQAQGCN